MRRTKMLLVMLSMSLMVLGTVSGASALPITITPDTAIQYGWSGIDPINPDAADISAITGFSVANLYNQDVGLADTGAYASSYATIFSNSSTDPQDASIKWVGSGSSISGDHLYLLVKDGQAVAPYWYLFDLTRLGWNGIDNITLDGFWPDKGALSHVNIYGSAPVPEPSTMLLLGSGLVGLAAFRKRFNRA
jgi:hypothetical protein